MEKVICEKYDEKFCPDYCPHNRPHSKLKTCKSADCYTRRIEVTCTPVKEEPTMKEVNEKLDKILQILQEKDSEIEPEKVSCNSYTPGVCIDWCSHIDDHVHNCECEEFCYNVNKQVRCV